MDLPCPAVRQGPRFAPVWRKQDDRRALFLVDRYGEITGAYLLGSSLSALQAQHLFEQYPWRPLDPEQPWPAGEPSWN